MNNKVTQQTTTQSSSTQVVISFLVKIHNGLKHFFQVEFGFSYNDFTDYFAYIFSFGIAKCLLMSYLCKVKCDFINVFAFL